MVKEEEDDDSNFSGNVLRAVCNKEKEVVVQLKKGKLDSEKEE